MGRSFISSFLVTVASNLAFAYPAQVDFSGTLLRWDVDANSSPVLYEIIADSQSDLSLYGPIVHTAAEMWSEVESSFFRYAAKQTSEVAHVTIHLERNFQGSSFSAGYAVFDETEDDGTPVHCEIKIAMNINPSLSSFGQTVLHELGHCLGLGHSLIPEAVMSHRIDKNGFFLATDDLAALSRLYPNDASEKPLPPGCGISHATSNAAPIWLFVFPILLVFLSRETRLKFW